MNTRTAHGPSARVCALLLLPLLPLAAARAAAPAQTPASVAAGKTQPAVVAPATPAETVRAFYDALRERRFREAFALSIFRPAVEKLSADEFEELRPYFEKIAANAREKVEILGEQVSGDTATVFARVTAGDDAAPPEPVTLMRDEGRWVVGDPEKRDAVRKSGKDFFFKVRVEAHHDDAQNIMQRITVAQLLYSSQHGGAFADLATLVGAGLMPQDILTPDTTGYRFHVNVTDKGRGYAAGAEPLRYGRTGRLSYYADQVGGVRSEDKGGKPLKAPSKK